MSTIVRGMLVVPPGASSWASRPRAARPAAAMSAPRSAGILSPAGARAAGGMGKGSFPTRLPLRVATDRKKVAVHAVMEDFPAPSAPRSSSGAISVPLDNHKLLGVPVGASASAVEEAYNKLIRLPLEDGYSDAVEKTRAMILDDAQTALTGGEDLTEGPDSMRSIPWEFLPGALQLLQEAGEAELVIKFGNQALKRKNPVAFDRDVLLSMALANCDMGREALSREEVAVGCSRLNEALRLLQDAGQKPPLAPNLAMEIDASLEALVPPCVLEHLALPDSPEHQDCRQGALKVLHAMMLRAPSGQPKNDLSASYVRAVLRRLSAQEVVDIVPWGEVAQRTEEFPWVWKAGLVTAALAHISTGVVQRRPQLISQGGELLAAAERGGAATPVEMCVVALLLGQPEAALACLGFDDPSLLDPMSEARDKMSGSSSNSGLEADFALQGGGGMVMATSQPRMSPRQLQRQALRYVCDASGLVGERAGAGYGKPTEEDLLPGLCLFAEKWMSEVAFTRFRDTAAASPSLVDFFNDKRVTRYLASNQPDSVGLLEEDKDGVSGVLQRGGRAWGKLVWGTVGGVGSALGGRPAPAPRSGQASAAGAVAPAAAGAVVPPLDLEKNDLPPLLMRSVEESPPQLRVRPAGRKQPQLVKPRTWPRPLRQATALVILTGAVALASLVRRDVILKGRRRPAGARRPAASAIAPAKGGAARAPGKKQGAAGVLDGIAEAAKGAKARGDKVLDGLKKGAAGGGGAAGAKKASAKVPAAGARPVISPAAAEKLIRRWQVRKAAALGETRNVGAIKDVLAEPMLSQWRDRALEAKKTGFHWRYQLKSLKLDKLEEAKAPPVAGGSKWEPIMLAEVVLEEFAELVGPNGKCVDTYSTKYRAKYEMKYGQSATGGGPTWLLSKGTILKDSK